MNKQHIGVIGIIILFLIQGFSGCVQQNDTHGDIPTIIIDTEVSVTSGTINNMGGVIYVNNTGTLLDGLEIVVPEQAYSQTTDFTISYNPIKNHTLGNYFHPITPLIHIENGGEYADKIMTVTIPVDIPKNHFSMAFYFDEQTDELEGIPLIDKNNDSITIATRHFSDIVVSSILIDLLFDDISTGFVHGVDDWQFTNYGSYAAPGGHCSGQCIAAMYYFNELKETKKVQLYGTYDNDGRVEQKTPNLQYDDEKAYKLCSMVQISEDWRNGVFIDQYCQQYLDANDTLTFLSFAYSMLQTGKPQYVAVYRYNATGKTVGGHALIAYKIVYDEETGNPLLYISDPNYPYKETDKQERMIIYNITTNKFMPYTSAEKSGATGHTYTGIYYFSVTPLISWNTVRWFWQELESGTIGIDTFPSYDIEVFSQEENEFILLENTFETYKTNINLRVNFKSDLANGDVWFYTPDQQYVRAGEYDREFDTCNILIDGLKYGDNLIGLYMMGSEKDKTDTDYIGFDWITIKRVIKDLGPQSARIVIFATFDSTITGEQVFIEGKKILPTGGTKDRIYAKGELFGTTYAYQFDYTLHEPENYIQFTAGTVDGYLSATTNVTYDSLVATDYMELTLKVT